MYRFYCENIESNRAFLDEVESNHCKNVLRVKEGQQVEVTNGKGVLWEGICAVNGKKGSEIELTRKIETNQKPNLLTLVLAPTKNPSRLEWFIEKSTEIGVGRIIPLITKRTEKVYLKTERLKKVIVSAGKQSKVVNFPILEEPISYSDYFKKFYKKENQNYIAHCIEGHNMNMLSVGDKNKECHILIGPEGDFTPEEIKLAQEHGYVFLSLGENRLRVETAALHAVSIYNYLINT